MIKSDIKILKERALAGDLSALEELRKMGLLSGKKSGYVIAPASYSQRRLWFIDQMDKSPAYNLPALIKFSGELDIDALERSFKELIKRHETLRTVFTENEGVPYQKIYTTSDFRLKKEDVRGREDKSSIIDELIREESRRCFDLTGGPLLVCSLLRTEESEYILIFNMHHIISDGWSIGVMIAELTSFYNAFSSGKEAEISPLPVQYRDYAKRQEGILNSPQAEIHRDYWVDKFSGEIPLPDLVADNARPLQKSYSGAVYVTQIEKNLLPEIKELCYKTESSLFMFLLSVVNLLINKYTGKTDIILGTPVSGREYGDTEGLIGFFVNTIPLRNKIDPDADFNSLLNSVKNESLNSFDHQMYPFDLLVEELGTERDTSRNPLFETVVSLQDKQENTLPFRGVRAEIAEPDINYSKFDLHFSFEESPQELGVRIVYNPDLYRRAKIEKMAGHLGVLIENIIASPDVPLRRLEFISKEESDYIKKTLSNKSSAKTSEKSIVELFSEIVTKYPQKPAVVYRGIPLSYTQLDNRSDTYASRLKEEYCIKRDEVVAVLMGRSHELLVSILGILKAGGAYLPVDENMPEERINVILEDAEVRVVISDRKRKRLSDSGRFVITSGDFSEYPQNRQNTTWERSASNLAYIIYTSGSTGVPKGTMIEDKAVVSLVRNRDFSFINSRTRIFATSSISFDATVFDMWSALLNCGTLYLEDTEDYIDPARLKDYFSEYKINTLLMSAGFFARVAEEDAGADTGIFDGVKTILAGGEKMSCKAADIIVSRYPGASFYNVYGPTENTVLTTVYRIDKKFDKDIPIGKAISGTELFICNDYGNLCPEGIPGELYIGGKQVSIGYLNRPGLNKTSFVRTPWYNGTLYRSGDIVSLLPDGNIHFIGRNDDQLKIRGFRIELGELESNANQMEGVTNVKALPVAEGGQKELALYFTSVKDISRDEYREFLSKKLPEYLLPKYVVRMDRFPLNKNGKIDSNSFPIPDMQQNKPETLFSPSGKTESTLIKIFKEILDCNTITAKDNFFNLGGHSLKAIRAVSAIRKELKTAITLKEFFSNPDIKSLGEIIKDKKREELGNIPVTEESEYYELSFAQKRLWVLDKIEKLKSTYNIPVAVRVKEEIDIPAMERSYRDLLTKHESLRSVFVQIDGEPRQKAVNDKEAPIILNDFSNTEDPEKGAFVYISSDAERAFDLSGYPLIRFYIIKISPADYVLFLNIHHIICDGWSLGVITEELFGGYQNYLKHSFNPVIPLKIQYRDYSQWQNNSIKAGSHNSDRDYWLERLGGEISPVEIPADFLRPAVKSYDGDSIYYSFSGDFKKRLDDFNSKRHCSLFMTLNAVLKVLLHRYSGKTDIIIGTPVAGRDHPDLESQVGNYVNMLALRDTLDPDISFARLLEQVKESSAEGFSHQMYPFDKLVEELRLPRDTSRSPLFDIVLVLQNFDIDPSRCFTSAEPYQVPVNISKYDITFNFNDKAKELDLLIEYNTRLFRKERVQLIASHLKVLLEKLLEDPSCIISKVNIPDKEEEKDLLTGYNNTAADYPDKETIISLFEKSAREYAGRTALVYKDKKLTYNQLNTHADSLSRFIRCNYTPGTGEVTGVFLSPSENTVIALLAVLKAGGAYLPLDPEYPDERISHILSESRIKIALTTAPLKERLQRIAKQAGCDCVILDIEKADKASATIPSPSSSPAVLPDTTAYVIFTSGSTGKPKGCQISHRNLVRLFFNDRNHFDFGPEDVWIMAHSFCFDFSVWEMYGALLYGGKLIIPERSEVRDISAFVKIVSGQKVTVLNQTPGAFYKFSEYLTGSREEVPLNLRYVIFGGDKLDPSKLGEWIKIHPASAISLVNMYGITETTIHVTYHKLTGSEIISSTGSSNIGKPLPETKVYILDEHKMLVPKGIYGEIYVGGSGVCKGYLNRPELTSERFIQNPYNDQEILYKSGDIGRWLCDGTLEYLDRSDNQVQIRGFRVEMAEIEMRLRSMDGITDVAVIAVDREGTKELAAYLVSEKEQKVNELKGFLSASLPEYMIPAYFIRTDKIPLTSNGKLDKKNLPPAIQNIATGVEFENPENDVESVLLKIWQTVLSTENISIRDNFFDIGGNSILLVRLHSKIDEVYPGILEITDLFSESTIAEQAHFIASRINPDKKEPIYGDEEKIRGHKSDGVAITGIALRIGSSQTPGEFWKELCNGSDLIGDLPESRKRDIEELAALYDNYRGTLNYRQYCYLNEVDKFDYGFFRLSPSEAALIDPGQRMFLETACHAIEDAGYGGDKLWGARTGIYIGASDNFSEYNRFIDSSGETDQNLLLTAQTPSILASRLSYFLNLKGPAMLVDTACSSSLVALHLACQAIREGKIDSALVGGVKLHLLPLDSGSRSGIDSSDSRAHCFDDSADGTGGGEGVIAIFVKSLEKALEENDNIYAVIRGSEINQDGSTIGITAPDADAQADVIDKAWKDAGIDPLTVSFIETHGTATKLGDPVEIEGITRAFRKHTAEKSFCAIGAIKANIGHLDTAAGLAGVVKAALSLSNRKLTPLVHFNTPNRNIRFEESPVYINKELTDWISNGTPLRCGVSSFGLSGTNCHVVMEEAPQRPKGVNKVTTGNNLFVLSARSEQILERYLAKIRETLIEKRNIDPRNLCYTLATGRGHHSCRTAVIFDTVEELVQKLERGETEVKCVKIASPARINLQGEEIKDPLKVAEAYLNGAEILWEDYFAARYSPDNFPSRISLPGYPFEKSRCWVKLRDRKQVEKSSAYGRNYNNLFLNECIAETPTLSLYKLNIQGNSWLVDEHRLMGTPTMVGTTYLQIAYEAGKIHFNSGNLLIEELYLLKPLVLSHSLQEVILSVNKNPDGSINAEVQSREGENIWHTYARFCVRPASEKEYQNPDIERVIKNCSLHKVTTAESREADKDNPVETSDKWNISADIHWNDNESVARLEIPAQDSPAAGSFWLYPPLTDAALSYALDEPGYVPFSFGTVRIISKMPDSVYSYVKKLPEESGGTRRYDIDITDTSGNTVVQFRGFTFKKVVLQSVQKFYELGWRAFKPQFPELPGFVNAALIYNSKCNPLLVDKIGQTPGIKGYCIDDGDYSVILNQEDKKLPDKVLYLLPESDFNIVRNSADAESELEESLYSAYNFAAYLSGELSSGMNILFLGENVLEVTGREKRGNPFGYAVAGLSQVLGREIPYLSCRFLDIDGVATAGEILNELLNGFKESYHYRAYREGSRYLREMNVLDPDKTEDSRVEIKDGGTYLITGGTGGIALELARWISTQKRVKLVLAGRSVFPSENEWGDILMEGRDARLCRKIKIIKEIISSGSEVIIPSCDVADYQALEKLTEKIATKQGRICGVIHTAGVAGEGFIHSKKPGDFKKTLLPKIHGTLNLVNLLRESPPDFFIMTSALTAVIPTAGQSDYTSANCFLDGCAPELCRKGIRAQSINFSAWKETGMAYERGVAEEGVFSPVSVEEGISALSTVLHKKIISVIPGRVNLSYLDKSAELPFLISDNILQKGSEKSEAKKEQPSETAGDQILLTGRDNGEYSETEIAVAKIWGEVLGYDAVGVGENYYDLGGDSIHAIKIIQLIGNKIKIKLSVGDLLNHLTIEELAVFLESKRPLLPDSKRPVSQEAKSLVSQSSKQQVGADSGENNIIKGKDKQADGFEILPAPLYDFYPVSAAQRRLFILDRLSNDGLSYHIPEIWQIKGNLAISRLTLAFEKLVKRHEILRTSFDLVNDLPVQIPGEFKDFEIPVLQMNEEDARTYIRSFIKPFDLGRAPLLRVEIIEIAPDNHLLLFDAHHIIVDAYSMEILKKEVFGYYNGIEQEPLRIQYKDYAVWQNGFVQRYETEKKKAYWINEFKEEIPVLNLPLDYPRSPANSAEAGVLSFALDEKLVSCIKKLSAKEGISPFMFLLAVYNIVIHKYTQQDDIVIGVTTLGRDSQDLSRLIGMFVNNLPVRSKPEDQLTVGNYLKQIKQKLFDSFANQDYPFDELVESLNIVRDITRSPLFDVVFSYMNFELSGMKNSEISISDYRSGISLSSEYDLMLYGLEAQERIYFTIKYKKALFRKESIQKFANHFTQAATIAAGNSDIRISELDIILPAERERILSLNDGTLQISSKPDVLEFFEKAVTLNPDGIAVTHKENRLTYRELDELSNKVANWLRDKCGVRPDDLVGIMVERTEQMIVAILGVIKSGAAYVGIDTAYPVKRVEYILKDSRAKVLLTENHILRNISLPDEVDAIIEDIRSQEIAGSSSSQPVNVNLPENIAYVIYTSGTTGDPKGVTITRGNLSLFLQWCLHDYGENSYQIAYATSSYCFDISVFEIFYTLITGKTIKVLKSAMEIPSNATADKDILIMTVPSLFAEIKEELLKKGIDNISLINLGGEQIPHGLLDGIDCDRIEVRNLYGPSEDTTFTTFYKFSNTNRKTLIGRPVANTRIYITDKYLKLVPEGHSGEICIAGEKLSKGYLYKDHLTREKFVNNPYGNGLIYKTGDLGRWTSSGDLEYLGRIDRQVKIHGYRIELGEIETCIRTCPSVENVAVTVYRKDGDKEIAAYIVLNKQTEMKDIKEFLSQNLPSFMIPLYFVVMDKIPLTPNGKVDISALPEPGVVGITDRSDHTENNKPVNPVEIRLASVWKKVLEREEISRSDNFFDLGGHSLKAIRLLSAINREFVTEFRLSDVFDYPTIAGFSKIISDRESEPEADIVNREAKTAGREAETVRKETEKVRREAESVSLDTEAADKRRTIVPLEKAEWYEVSYAQRRLWTIDRVEEKSFAYNVPVVYHVKSRIDTDALQKAFEALIFKYESFRTAFIEVDGDPKQVITDKAEFKIKVIEIPSGEDIKTGSREHVINAVKESFDLRVAPLLKVTLIRYPAGDESVMVINIHHIIVDEWSVGILAENLALFYNHFTGIEPVTDRKLFNPDEIQYKDYAAWHNSQLQENSPLAMEGEKFWMEMFSDPVEPLNLPADYKRPKVQTFKGQTVDFVLPPEISSALRQLSSDNNSTLFITTLALFNVLFYKYTGQKDIVIGTPVASRDAYEIKDQIGFFLNTIALRNKLVDSQNFNEFLAGVRDNTLKAYNNQSYPFDRLVEKVLQSRDLSRSPLFDVMLISQTPERNSGEMFKGVNMELMESEYQASKFDLSVSYCDDGSEIKYFFEYNTSIYREESIRNMFRHYMTMLEDLLGNPGKTLYSLSMISAQEKEELLALSAGNNRTLAEKSVVSLIEKQAAEFGNRTAVIFKRKKLSYNELNSKANRLSGILNNEMGVTPGDIVCVMLDRSEWSVISLLAILKAGAVYLPVDPLYPASRIRYIFEDCKGKVLITSDNHSSLLSGLYNGKIITTEQIEERAEQYGSDNPESGIDISCSQAAPAYIIYTSGSTGEPKGVIGTHKCLLNLMVWQGELLETELRILQYAPHSFDVSVQEMVFSMASAATLYMTDQDTRFKMQVIADLIEKEEIQMVTMPFSALNLFLEENEDPGKLKSLKHLVTSGEQPYMNDNISGLMKTLPGLKFHNQYGPSETHVVTYYMFSQETMPEYGKIPAGRPINNTLIYLLDNDMQLVPAGLPGEIYIGGYNLASGYLNKRKLTGERFIANPFGEGVLYKSGDIARWDAEGNLDFLGRGDRQVKVRGFRIELGEIESHLINHEHIKECAVKLTGSPDNPEIAAYYTSDGNTNSKSVRDYLSLLLPGYMIPQFLTEMESIPHLASGKIDVRALPEPAESETGATDNFTEPSGETELIIAQVWKEILNRSKIGIYDNFFESGGNSIKAIQAMSRIQKRLGKKIYLNLIFKEPTISGMAGVIQNTEEQLKNMDKEIVLLNEECGNKIFFLPPGIGYSFAYMEYARHITNFSVYGINFIESEDPAGAMTELILEVQKSGKYFLFGHSAGGNMAYDVALKLIRRGKEIGGIIMLDSYRQMEILSWSEDEYLNDAILYIEQNHAEFLDEEIKDAAFRKIMAYRRYLNARSEKEKLNCTLLQIEANDEIPDKKNNLSRSAWKELTPDFKVYQGFGGHMDMLKRPNLEKNAQLTARLLSGLNEKVVKNDKKMRRN